MDKPDRKSKFLSIRKGVAVALCISEHFNCQKIEIKREILHVNG